jgi:monoamine oxidase
MKRRRLLRSAALSGATLSALALGIGRPARAADLDVVIVGAGVAGLAAARTLMAAHKSVLVVEARERIGGRAVTDSTTFGFPFDQGAQWIEAGKTNPAMAILREANAKPILDRQEQTLYLGGTELPREEYARFEKIAVDASRKIAAALKKPPPFSALGVTPGKEPDVIVGRLLAPQDPLERLAYALVGPLESGVENNELSARDFTRQPDTEPQYSVADGLGALIARWGGKVPVKLATRVVRVDSTGTLLQIVTTGGELNAKAVIVTVPTGVLAAGSFGFAPQLKAAKREAITQLPMALYNKIALSFARKAIDAPAGRSVSGLTRQGQAFDAIVRPHNRDAAVVFVGGAHARELEEQGGAAAASFALSAMAEIYGDELRGVVAHSFATRWGKDPFARGSWSMAIPGRVEARLVLAQPHHDRVFFAGEATDPVWATRVGGAYASGLRAAGEALAVLGSRH